MRTRSLLPALLSALLLGPAGQATAQAPPAAPPPPPPSAPANDDRDAAAPIAALPASVNGTLSLATRGQDEASPAVWYRYVAATDGRFLATFAAKGELDADVSAFLRTRSQLRLLDSEASDEKGVAGLSFRVRAGQTVLVRVSLRPGSTADAFSLFLSAAAPDVRPPGVRLTGGGVTSTLDRVLRPVEAYSYSMREGVTYRINMVPVTPPKAVMPAFDPDADEQPRLPDSTCRAELSMYAPGTRSLSDRPLSRDGCDSYRLFTPGRREGGRYVFRVSTRFGSRGPQRFHLQVSRATETDTAPGLFLANQRTTRGSLDARGVNRVDLYRFALKRRSRLKLSLAGPGGVRLTLRNDRGRLVTSDSSVDREIAAGRYFVTVTAQVGTRGGYRIRRSSRTITRAGIAISGVARARAKLGVPLNVSVRLRPAVGGAVRVTYQRFDPEAGWQFLRSVKAQAQGGRLRLAFTPPSVGRFRARAEFLGTGAAAGSATGFANVLVVSG